MRLAIAVAERKVRLPDSSELRTDFRQVRKLTVVNGLPRLQTERSGVGHADRFWSAALGLEAASLVAPAPFASLPRAALPKG